MSRSIRIGTFNLYNLVLPNISYYENRLYTVEEYTKKKHWIADQLNRMQADCVGFQEVFHEQALQEVLVESQQYNNANLIVANPTGEKPTVALVSKLPILRHEVIEAFPQAATLALSGEDAPLSHFAHPVLKADVVLDETIECTVFVVHLKSKRPVIAEGKDRHDPIELTKGKIRSLIQRAAETAALRVLLLETMQHSNRPVILMGDINDNDRSVTSRLLSGESPDPNWENQYKQQNWDVLLYFAKDIQARQTRGDFYFTHMHDAYYESLDHILLSQEFMSQNPHHIAKVQYVSVFNDHLIDQSLTEHPIEVWKSDHGQVIVQIELRRSHPIELSL